MCFICRKIGNGWVAGRLPFRWSSLPIDHVAAMRALKNPNPDVQSLARSILRELAAEGDPFASKALRGES